MISIIVPYRDRSEHLAEFLKAMEGIKQEKEIIIVEQEEGKPFNRGKLLNIGAIYSTGTHLIMHDVDMIPMFKEYPCRRGVTQLAKSNIQAYGYLGGVTMFESDIFFNSGGYPNDYFSRAEDNSMKFNLDQLGIKVENNFLKFKSLNHERPKIEFDPILWHKSQQPRIFQDQIGSCKFTLLESIEANNFRMMKVSI